MHDRNMSSISARTTRCQQKRKCLAPGLPRLILGSLTVVPARLVLYVRYVNDSAYQAFLDKDREIA